MTATYTKLRSGQWGIRVQGTVTPGETVQVKKKSGETKTEIVSRVVWAGNGVALCAISSGSRGNGERQGNRVWDSTRFNGYGAPKGGWRKACVTGGNCSSFGSGRSCGGHDCDGY